MKVGIITPIKFLDKYCITDIQYCLPSLLVDNELYKKFYIKRKIEGDAIILDCKKVGWKREPEDFRVVEESLKVLHPNLIIAPSYMFNLKDSLDIYKAFSKRFSFFNHIIIRCLEGPSGESLSDYPKDKTFAVPSHMYRYLDEIMPNPHTIFIENHLNLDELNGRKGILVTSLPIKLGLQGRLLLDYKPSINSLTFYEEEDNYPKIVMKNVKDTIEYYKEVK